MGTFGRILRTACAFPRPYRNGNFGVSPLWIPSKKSSSVREGCFHPSQKWSSLNLVFGENDQVYREAGWCVIVHWIVGTCSFNLVYRLLTGSLWCSRKVTSRVLLPPVVARFGAKKVASLITSRQSLHVWNDLVIHHLQLCKMRANCQLQNIFYRRILKSFCN